MATAGALVNTSLHAYPTVGDLTGTPRFPDVEQLHPTSNLELERGASARISVPDTASHFGVFDAQVYLPPQYFSEPQRRFPVVILTHGNPGRSTDWLDEGSAAQTGLTVAQSGHPVILVMPTVLQEPYGDSLCVDTALEGNAETYVVKDVVAAADAQLRTMPGAAHRAIGGFSMGGFCALNLGLKHPDVFSVVLAFSALTVCEPDAIEGGNETLFGTPDWQQQVAANSPADYWRSLDPATSPAMWLDVGEDESEVGPPLQAFAEEALLGRVHRGVPREAGRPRLRHLDPGPPGVLALGGCQTRRVTSTPGLRPITEADVPAVLALNHRFVDLLSPLDAERLLWLVGLADHADVVELDDRVVGFVLTMAPGSEYDSDNYRWHALRFDDAFYYLDRIVIAEEMRRRGLAGFVYDAMEDVARRFGRMTLEVNVDPPNHGSLAFHQRRGYVEVGRLGEPGHVVGLMAKELTA